MGEKIDNGDYVREYYRVPARKGQKVWWRGHPATIVAFDLAYLVLELDGHDPLNDDGPEQVIVHPTWEVEYPPPDPEHPPAGQEEPARDEVDGEPALADPAPHTLPETAPAR